MSLPPFLFSSATPANSPSTFSSTAAGGSGVGAGPDFRQAFMQLSQSTAPSPAPQGSSPAIGNPLLAKLNLLMEEGGLLPEELQASLQGFIDDLPQGVTLADLSVDANLPANTLGAWRELVDLLTGGKVLPLHPSVEAMDLSEDGLVVDSDAAAIAPYVALLPEASPTAANLTSSPKSADALSLEQSNRLDLGQWSEKGSASGQQLKSEVFSSASQAVGFSADVTLKTDSPASSLGAILPPDLELAATLISPAASATAAADKASLLTPADTAMKVQVAFGHARWAEALAERAAWFAGQNIHSAELQLDPPELGPLQVRISVHQDQAVVSFVSANPQVRDALDQSMMRLRELLQEQGMQLVDAGVSDQQRDEDSEGRDATENRLDDTLAGEQQESDQATVQVVDTRYGVDDFA